MDHNNAHRKPRRPRRALARIARARAYVRLPGQLAFDFKTPTGAKRKRLTRRARAVVETIPLDLGAAAVPVAPAPKFIGPMPEYTAVYEHVGDDEPAGGQA
jgi:hypothetical protein